jgi:hypothetical protein
MGVHGYPRGLEFPGIVSAAVRHRPAEAASLAAAEPLAREIAAWPD